MKKERELITAMNEVKGPLDTFGQEVDAVVATIPTPPLDYFHQLVAQTQHATRRQRVWESLLFLLIACFFLVGVGFLLAKGYLRSILIAYTSIALGLPFLILWSPIHQEREVN